MYEPQASEDIKNVPTRVRSLKGPTHSQGQWTAVQLFELPLKRREGENTNQVPKHRAPMPESADQVVLSGERPWGFISAEEKQDPLETKPLLFFLP